MPKKTQQNGYDPNSDLADRLMYALSNPLRRRMVKSLMREPASAKTLSDVFGVPLGNLSYHLSKVLFERCALVEIVATYPRRGALEKVYGVTPDAQIRNIEWPDIPASLRSGLNGLGLSDFLTAAIAAMEAEPNAPEVPNLYSWQPVAVDLDGQKEILAAAEGLNSTVRSVAARCAGTGPACLVPINVGAAVFEAAPGPAEETA